MKPGSLWGRVKHCKEQETANNKQKIEAIFFSDILRWFHLCASTTSNPNSQLYIFYVCNEAELFISLCVCVLWLETTFRAQWLRRKNTNQQKKKKRSQVYLDRLCKLLMWRVPESGDHTSSFWHEAYW